MSTSRKTSTLKPFAHGDIFIGNTYLNNPDDDHMGEGRIIQLDRNFIMKGTWYTSGTRYLIVGWRRESSSRPGAGITTRSGCTRALAA